MVIAKLRKYSSLIIFIIGILVVITSCKDKDLPPPTPLTTYLNVVNATADTIKYYINGTRQNNISDLYVGGSTGYVLVLAGTQNYKFSKSDGNFAVLFTTTFTLDTAEAYSIFVAGTTPDMAFRVIDPLGSADDVIAADSTLDTLGTASAIRFVNASPGAGALNVTVGAGDTVNFNNCPFKYVSSYTLLNAAAKEVKVFQAGSGTAAIDTTITFASGTIYTLFTKGQLNGKGSAKFGVSLTSIAANE